MRFLPIAFLACAVSCSSLPQRLSLTQQPYVMPEIPDGGARTGVLSRMAPRFTRCFEGADRLDESVYNAVAHNHRVTRAGTATTLSLGLVAGVLGAVAGGLSTNTDSSDGGTSNLPALITGVASAVTGAGAGVTGLIALNAYDPSAVENLRTRLNTALSHVHTVAAATARFDAAFTRCELHGCLNNDSGNSNPDAGVTASPGDAGTGSRSAESAELDDSITALSEALTLCTFATPEPRSAQADGGVRSVAYTVLGMPTRQDVEGLQRTIRGELDATVREMMHQTRSR